MEAVVGKYCGGRSHHCLMGTAELGRFCDMEGPLCDNGMSRAGAEGSIAQSYARPSEGGHPGDDRASSALRRVGRSQ